MRIRSAIGSSALAVTLAGFLGLVGEAAGDLSCASFVSQADAQAVLDANPDDRFGLDPDRNGVACDNLDDSSPTHPTAEPTAKPARFADPTAADVDRFWRRAFKKAEQAYASPAAVRAVEPVETTPCGLAGYASPAFYCPLDQTIYYDDAYFVDRDDGEYGQASWTLMLAHEWGHHAQDDFGLLDDYAGDGDATAFSMALELQAQCAAGAYLRDALRREKLSTNEVDEAVLVAHTFLGDRVHGTSALQGDAFERGLTKGLAGCGYPL